MSPVARALLDELEPGDLRELADRLAPYLPHPSNEGYMNAAQAAEYIGASRQRVHDLTYSGRLPAAGHDGRKPLYRRTDLDTYILT
jgi:excisionase family DNA binding protein